ncbi:hypothetical protein RN001_004654 [Aquatica leii]|uniref:DDE Tnp4 domain-containing protein n=1 Tax=Aquatica leii TaxID=1421715 RepID=A0AAN7P5L7_9COLE|nr:hypothetical protein RN001_004654 [Aquatica leii]
MNEADQRNDLIIPRPKLERTYNQEYMENIVQNYNLFEFKNHFRMSRKTMEELCTLVAPYLQDHIYFSLEKKECFFIWILTKQESFFAVSDRFGVVGAIEGTDIIIRQPINNAINFYNRKEQHSIILQGVCDDNRVFTDVFIGIPDKFHKTQAFRNSLLYSKLVNNPPLLLPQRHILGDAAYPVSSYLLKPYRDNGHPTAQQLRINEVMSGQRSVIERAFCLLKGKWRRLKLLDMLLDHLIRIVVLVACI